MVGDLSIVLSGVVSEFSDERGLGTLSGDDAATYLFHVIEIVDGTRTVAVGQRVTFNPLPKFGKLEAGKIRKV